MTNLKVTKYLDGRLEVEGISNAEELAVILGGGGVKMELVKDKEKKVEVRKYRVKRKYKVWTNEEDSFLLDNIDKGSKWIIKSGVLSRHTAAGIGSRVSAVKTRNSSIVSADFVRRAQEKSKWFS